MHPVNATGLSRGIQLELDVHPRGTLFEAIEWMLTHRKRPLSDATEGQHRDHRRWLIQYFGNCNVNDITYEGVMKYIDDQGPSGEGLLYVTVKKRLVTLRLALEQAINRKLRREPVDWWPDLPNDGKPNELYWTYDQYKQARLAFEPEQRIAIDIFFFTGMHLSDVRRWRRSDVKPGHWRRYNTKSHARPEWLPISPEFEGILQAWFTERGLVGNEAIAPELWQYPSKPYRRVCHRADVPRCTPNTLRSSCVSRLFELGCSLEFIAHWLGHQSDPKLSPIIRKHYLRWTPSSLMMQAANLR